MSQFFGDISPELLLIVLAGFWFSGVVKGLLGFGQPLVAMAILPFFIPVETILVVNALLMPVTNLAQFLGARVVAKTLRKIWPVIIGLTVGVPIGAVLTVLANEAALLFFVGAVVAGFSIFSIVAPTFRIPPRSERMFGIINGVAAGVVGALTTVNGPVFVMYLAGLKISRTFFVSAIGILFFVSGLMMTAAFSIAGIMELPRFFLALSALPLVIVGMRIGDRLGKRMSDARFRGIVLAALFLLGIGLMWRSLSAL